MKLEDIKHISDIIVSWTTLLFAIFAGGFALYKYTQSLSHNRINESLKFVKEFRERKNNTESLEMSLEKLLRLSSTTATKVIFYYKQPQSPSSREIISNRIKEEINKEIRAENLENEVLELFLFFNTIINCSKEGSCHNKTLSIYFGREMFNFINDYCYFFQSYGRLWKKEDLGDEIFIFTYKNQDFLLGGNPFESEKFFCKRHYDLYKELEAN